MLPYHLSRGKDEVSREQQGPCKESSTLMETEKFLQVALVRGVVGRLAESGRRLSLVCLCFSLSGPKLEPSGAHCFVAA